ncbi:MAG: cell division protein ZapA [Clostridia bacterium]|nr:cell division protein ZapA [Clostridia bacterium]
MQNQKIRVTVRIAGKDYTIASTDAPEYVNRVAGYVDRKMNELSLATHLPASQLAVLAAINATDDMLKSRDEIDRLRREGQALHQQTEQLKADLADRDREIARLTAALEAKRADA